MTAIRACKSEGAFVFSDAVKARRRDAHTQQHTPTLFRMNKPEENNNNNNSSGGPLLVGATLCGTDA